MVIIHASVEHPSQIWGGLGAAIGMIAEATARVGIRTVTISPGDPHKSKNNSTGYQAICLPVGSGQLGSIYRSKDRMSAGEELSQRIFRAIGETFDREQVALFIHNEELATLCELCDGVEWITVRAAINHGILSLEHPLRSDLSVLQNRLLNSADVVYAVSKHQVSEVRSRFPRIRNIRELTLPLELIIDFAADSNITRTLQGVDRKMILFAGRSVVQKGTDLLIEAVNSLGDRNLNLILALGHGELHYEKRCTELALEANCSVAIVPWMDRVSLLRKMSEASFLVVPSHFEPLGIVAAEAMAIGTPVVATRTGGLVELLHDDHESSLVTPNGNRGPDPNLLAKHLALALSTSPRITNGSRILRSKYSVNGCVSSLHLQDCFEIVVRNV